MCDCDCHAPGLDILHFMSCCDLCYTKRSKREQRKLDEAAMLRKVARADLEEWAYWRTTSLTPVEPSNIRHEAARVTIMRVYDEAGVTWVRYMYCDYYTTGLSVGRDEATLTDFRKMFPVKRDFSYDG